MSSFIRRFGFDPGNEVLLEIESFNVLDLDPPANISGIGTGTVLCLGEFENGSFAAASGVAEMAAGVVEVAGATDFVANFGSLGYSYGGVPANNPCARARSADSAVVAENWNGNGFVQLSGKKFRRLLIARVDTSVGSVQFKRQAFFTGGAAFTYDLEPGQVLVVTDSGTDRTATFDAAAATVQSGVKVYPVAIAGGETITLGYDDAANFTVTFLAGDVSQALIAARINQYAGFAFCAAVSTDKLSLTGIRRGAHGAVRIVSGSAGLLTLLGFTAATTTGTGDAGDIDAVTFQEIKALVESDMTAGSIKVTQDNNGALRLQKAYATSSDWLTVKSTTTATGLGFTSGEHASNTGYAYLHSTAGTYPTSFAGGETITLGNDDGANFTVVFGADTTQALVIARINQFAGYAMASSFTSTVTRLRGNKNGGQVRVISASAGVFTALGFSAVSVTATALGSGKIPAGTVVQNSAGTSKFVTMQDVSVSILAATGLAASGVGPYPVKVRHATDDGTGISASTATLTFLERAIDLGSFDVTNSSGVTACLAEAAIDAAYTAALDATLDVNGVASEANVAWSARQSTTIRTAMKANANLASKKTGRMVCVRPPLNTAKATAKSNSAAPGVGATRDQRVIYCYPGANTFVPLVAKRGLAGGTGFTIDGNVDVGADGFMAGVLSQLPPEENPGQATAFMDAVNGLETGANVQGWVMEDYTAFRASGIAALRMDGGAIFQSGVTSVDPGQFPQLRNIARRRMADFIEDSISRRGKAFGKKLSTLVRRKALATEISLFLAALLSANNPSSQRIAGFSVDSKTGNTPETLAQGIYRIIMKVRTLASLDSIVLQATIGEGVTVDEQ